MDMDRAQQKDLVLNVNEYAYVLDQTKGNVVCWVGPSKTSLSNSDQLVTFNPKSKRFEPCSFHDAIKLFTIAPKGYYIVLKNPTEDGSHPARGTSNNIPEKNGMQIGKKINIEGPASFALYPGQMAKVIEGHILRSNQYIVARVYDAEAANAAQDNLVKDQAPSTFTSGQVMIIKGTEVAFYIPPTGFEIVKRNDVFVQDAVTLEKLEYCILKNEDGNKRYVQGPAVVFPEPTESFIKNEDGTFKFKAIELSKISGIYIKVIESYEEDGRTYKAGEELFITGKDQMIYYPRPEHAIIQYGNKLIHHATAVPKGEGRYVMDRLTGEIKTVVGSVMLLPDPRKEVIVKRKLSRSQCELWYPGNREVLEYNGQLSDIPQTTAANAVYSLVSADDVGIFASKSAMGDTSRGRGLATGDSFARGTEYSKPRTITLDTKFDGVVKLDIWTGYAVNIISSNGDRRVVVGPQSVLLDYDETLEVLSMSTGKPKTTDVLEKTVHLRCENNNVGDIINLETKDYIKVEAKLSYIIDFQKEYVDRWFAVENYVKFLCDRVRSKLKRAVKQYTIADFYNNSSKILREAVLDITDENDGSKGVLFPENGMLLKDVEILAVRMDRDIENLMSSYQQDIINNTMKLSTSEQSLDIGRRLAAISEEESQMKHNLKMAMLELERKEKEAKQDLAETFNRRSEAEAKRQKEAAKTIQELENTIEQLELEAETKRRDIRIETTELENNLDIERQKAQAENVRSVFDSISPDLVQAMKDKTNAALIETVAQHIGPYAVARGAGVLDTTERLIKGLPIDNALKEILNP